MQNELTEMEITNPEKILFKKKKIKKIDVIKYYHKVFAKIFPYLDHRLISVIRCHESVDKNCFFKKHPSTETDDVLSCKVKGEKEEFFYVNDEKSLLSQVQMGTIEFHIWASKINSIYKPDIMVFDLDPDEKMPLTKLRQGVKDLKKVLDQLNLVSFLKTSGGKGYHIVVPFTPNISYQKFKDLSFQIASVLENQYPNLYTTNSRKAERKGKIFIDYLRNSKGATCVCPYSLRAREAASVSMPISWKNLDKIAPDEVTCLNVSKYLKLKNEWKDFFNINQKIN